ncbi:hypothetical protein SKAU_G00169610 [Synaphobranchus kaupii]|uniref:Uncharacterized protein n=1 Tax=Synaphobranchus kaupii TaxID=118154 RepID=A0A9Q1IZN7_SYNKA|nr:hypothetical protein SKAU_G00169610 [Synaphobranchus kaupii]
MKTQGGREGTVGTIPHSDHRWTTRKPRVEHSGTSLEDSITATTAYDQRSTRQHASPAPGSTAKRKPASRHYSVSLIKVFH